jgi:hypothetical protein
VNNDEGSLDVFIWPSCDVTGANDKDVLVFHCWSRVSGEQEINYRYCHFNVVYGMTRRRKTLLFIFIKKKSGSVLELDKHFTVVSCNLQRLEVEVERNL